MTRLKRWAPWVLLAVLAVAALVVGLRRSSPPQTLDARVTHIASQVRCPVCNGESAAQSQAAPSVQIRAEIRADLERGMSTNQILEGFVASYGPGILEKPEASGVGLVVWVVPVVAVVLGGSALVVVLARWQRRAAAAGVPVDDPGADGVGDADLEVGLDPLVTVPGGGGPLAAESAPRDPLPTHDAVPGDQALAPSHDPVMVADPVMQDQPARTRSPRRWVVGAGVAVLVAAAGSWAIVHAVTTRLPGQPASGQSLGPEVVLADLQQARSYESKGDLLDAVKDYQKVLAADPTQVNALTEEGYLLAETGQPSLLQQGLAMLRSAEQSDPSFAEAHLYRGFALLGEDDYGDAVPELRWYLAHQPDPSLVSTVDKAVSQAEAGLKAGSGKSTSTTRP